MTKKIWVVIPVYFNRLLNDQSIGKAKIVYNENEANKNIFPKQYKSYWDEDYDTYELSHVLVQEHEVIF
jgi:hypothetical protein